MCISLTASLHGCIVKKSFLFELYQIAVSEFENRKLISSTETSHFLKTFLPSTVEYREYRDTFINVSPAPVIDKLDTSNT